ncbi:VOC family protein [Marinomonas dokdonensis]|uniref:VOC family protein n=1 Tax=Marinomonas dokdonensis TaxID=328224 RepID=UPI00405591C9
MEMNYVVLGTNNMVEAVRFYDILLADSGFNQVFATDRMTYWQKAQMTFALAIPFDQAAATNGNGSMLGFVCDSEQEVSALYHKALKLGGRCEGELGLRGPYYSAYVRDLDNNKLSFGCMLS